MNDMTVCGNHEALVSYLYDECKPTERDALTAHLAICASCAEELTALRDTRAHLASWTPPALSLGFQITRTDVEAPAKVLRPAAWYRQPLPAWAQVAAAALIFAAGVSVNPLRSTPAAPVASTVQTRTPVAAPVVSREDFAKVTERLQSLEDAQARTMAVQLPRTAAGAIDEGELLRRVSDLVNERVAQSEDRQYRVLDRVARGLNIQATERVSLMEEELLEQRQVIRTMAGTPWMSVALRDSETAR